MFADIKTKLWFAAEGIKNLNSFMNKSIDQKRLERDDIERSFYSLEK